MNKPPMTMDELKALFKEQSEKRKLEMKGIQRYSIVDGVLVENDSGDLVKFLDYAIEAGELRLQVTKAYNSGYSSRDSGYSWRL